jgi:uncharacterized protein (TIGR00369 family)
MSDKDERASTESALAALVAGARAAGEPSRLLNAIPYARMLGLRASLDGGSLVVCMPRSEHLVGNPVLPALHGGTVGALLESTAILELLWQKDSASVPKTITLTVDYLRSARLADSFARATITKLGRRVANVQVHAYQESPDKPIATANLHFLLSGSGSD